VRLAETVGLASVSAGDIRVDRGLRWQRETLVKGSLNTNNLHVIFYQKKKGPFTLGSEALHWADALSSTALHCYLETFGTILTVIGYCHNIDPLITIV